MDVMHYSIEDVDGEKVVHYLNFFASSSEAPDDMTPEELATWERSGEGVTDMVDLTFLYIPADKVAGLLDELGDLESGVQQYMSRVPDSKALEVHVNYYGRNNPGEYLPIDMVDEHTPYGHYWCDGYWFNE